MSKYVPIYIVSHNEIILTSSFWVVSYAIDGWTDKEADEWPDGRTVPYLNTFRLKTGEQKQNGLATSDLSRTYFVL